MLMDFSKSCEGKAEALEEVFRKRNWQEYQILIHAAKSNTRMIGALGVSEQEKVLEDVAKKGEAAYIEENHNRFLSDYRQIAKSISL